MKTTSIAFKQEFDFAGCSSGCVLVLDDVLSVNEEEFVISRNVIADGEEVIKQQEYEFDSIAYSLHEILLLRHLAIIFGKKRSETI